jgi:putative endonuclease
MPYWVYILRSCSTGQFYVGSSADLEERLSYHNAGRVNATKGRGPWTVAYLEEFASRRGACQRERAIKRQKSRRYIENLIAQQTDTMGL